MNKRALIFGIIYSVIVIIYKLIILLGGYQLTKFGFYYSHALSVFFIIPFMILAVKKARDDMGGFMSGRDAIKVGLGVFGISVIILSCYTYIEFVWKLQDISVEYYNSQAYLQFLKAQSKIKPEMYQTIIDENVKALSPMKAVTAKLFSFFLLSFSFSFIIAVFMKRRPA